MTVFQYRLQSPSDQAIGDQCLNEIHPNLADLNFGIFMPSSPDRLMCVDVPAGDRRNVRRDLG